MDRNLAYVNEPINLVQATSKVVNLARMEPSSSGSPRVMSMLSRFASFTNLNQIDQEFLQTYDVPVSEMDDWSDRPVEALDIESDYSDIGTPNVKLHEWISWGLGRYRRSTDSFQDEDGLMPRSRSLPTRLSGGNDDSRDTSGDQQSLAAMVRTVLPVSISQPSVQPSRTPPSLATTPSEYAAYPVEEAQVPLAAPREMAGDRIGVSSQPSVEAEAPPAIHRLYRSARVWLATEEETNQTPPPEVPVPRRRRNRAHDKAKESLQSIYEETNKMNDEEAALHDYLQSLDQMLSAVREQNKGNLTMAHKEAIRTKLEQGLQKLNQEQPAPVCVEAPARPAWMVSEDFVIPMMVNSMVLMMRMTLLVMGLSFHAVGIRYERQRPFKNYGKHADPAPGPSKRTSAPPPPPPQPPVNEKDPGRNGARMRTFISLLPLLNNPRETIRRIPLQPFLTDPKETLLQLAQAQSRAQSRPTDQVLLLPPSPTYKKRPLTGWARTAAVFARTVKRSPLPDQVHQFVRMVLAASFYVEQRLGIWHNISSIFIQTISQIIYVIKTYNLHILVVRILLTTIESFFAAIHAYQTEPSPIV